MIFNIADVKEDLKAPKDECIVPTDADVKKDDPATKALDDAAKPIERFVTTRLRSRTPSGGGVKQKTLDEGCQPERVSATFLRKMHSCRQTVSEVLQMMLQVLINSFHL